MPPCPALPYLLNNIMAFIIHSRSDHLLLITTLGLPTAQDFLLSGLFPFSLHYQHYKTTFPG